MRVRALVSTFSILTLLVTGNGLQTEKTSKLILASASGTGFLHSLVWSRFEPKQSKIDHGSRFDRGQSFIVFCIENVANIARHSWAWERVWTAGSADQ